MADFFDLSSFDFTKITEWDELIAIAGFVIMLTVDFTTGLTIFVLGALVILASEGYLSF